MVSTAFAAAVFLVAASPSHDSTAGPQVFRLPSGISDADVVDRGLIVRFRDGARTASAIGPDRGISAVKTVSPGRKFPFGFTLVKVAPDKPLGEAYGELLSDPNVLDVWPDVVRRPSFVPNDPKYLNNRPAGAITPDRQYFYEIMNAEEAWDKTTGSESVVVAVIDTGVDTSHEDLVTQFWQNPGEIAANNTDDDGNGYKDDIIGYDFYFGDSDPKDDDEFSGFHGTSTAGLVGARGNNAVGVMGAAGGRGVAGERGVKLMILRVGTDFTIKLSAEIEAIAYAVDNGADVINMSFGGAPGGNTERDAVRAAWNAGLVLVAAGGNVGAGAAGGAIDWPAAIDECIAVGATTVFPSRYPEAGTPPIEETIADYSKQGPEVELCAPGTALVTTGKGGAYTQIGNNSFTGTSGASPLVAGLAALIKSLDPDVSNAEIRTLMQESAVDLGLAGRDEIYGFGRVDFAAALGGASEAVSGDANGDGVVNDADVDEVVRLFGARIGEARYAGRTDTNRDGVVDELDLFAIGSNYGITVG
ncbi:MAG: S8 family serine peptidase [bacterium]|jgi:subtilisin family serine protease